MSQQLRQRMVVDDELTMDNDGSQVEEHARDLGGVRFEPFSHHDTIEQSTWLGQCCLLKGLGSHCSSVGGTGSPDMRIQNALLSVSLRPLLRKLSAHTLLEPSAFRYR